MKFVLIAILVAAAFAECPNACSGHGDCKEKDQCDCYRNWAGADCSKRICPFGLAFVDTPQGDLDHDGNVSGVSDTQWTIVNTWEQFPTTAADEAHEYMECSNKGLCNRDTGECQCLPGYEGSACQRTVCPNKCSGHGICRTIKEIAASGLNKRFVEQKNKVNVWEGVTVPFEYKLWDAEKGQACVCDAGYTGPDCSLRLCPYGDDPLTYKNVDCAGAACRNEVQVVTVGGVAGDSRTFTLTYTTPQEVSYTTYPIIVDGLMTAAEVAAKIETALEALPNDVIPDVTVTSIAPTYVVGGTFSVTFPKNSGNLNQLVIAFGSTCSDVDCFVAVGSAANDGNKEIVMCSNRGLCDYSTGMCKCFKGYTNYNCDTQSALAM
jgi:hypothetical protein